MENGYDLSKYHIYGGGNQAAVTGDTLVTMAGGTVGNIYGGGLDAAVTGSTHVVVGGTVQYGVIGGGKIRAAGSTASVLSRPVPSSKITLP